MKLFIKINFLGLLLVSMSSVAALQDIGVVKFSRGVVAAENKLQAESRLIAKGEKIYLKDTIQTAAKSFVILAFNDGSKITLRPESSFSINEYVNKKGGDAKASFKLNSGGARVVTGDIANNTTGKYQINTKDSNIKPKNSDFSLRICKENCQEGKEPRDDIVARISKLKGSAMVKRNHKEKKLGMNSVLYEHDLVITSADSYAVLAFKDKGIMTLQEKTKFEIKEFKYTKNEKTDRAVYNFITGGLRVLSGKIGKVNKQNFSIKTPVATIGIRGTGFDLVYKGNKSANCSVLDDKKCTKASGLKAYVWNSEIVQTNASGSFKLKENQSNNIASESIQPEEYTKVPDFFIENEMPRPDKVILQKMINFANNNIANGLYIKVNTGNIKLNNSQSLKEGDSARVGDKGDVDSNANVDGAFSDEMGLSSCN